MSCIIIMISKSLDETFIERLSEIRPPDCSENFSKSIIVGLKGVWPVFSNFLRLGLRFASRLFRLCLFQKTGPFGSRAPHSRVKNKGSNIDQKKARYP